MPLQRSEPWLYTQGDLGNVGTRQTLSKGADARIGAAAAAVVAVVTRLNQPRL
eukprot:CAMPEP_0177663424 /NCGR_PEP_ID=MMETSP0447-20121125/19903_1 /TAXON_ID=0 /ORGANISM="Stygamoeba regulata, Strain BSH-02190019" /LENGTH=52 /DNA_ID=CAMNT_0019169229 /DNA_START=10 /DNA_END=169 /DNA_ORIENTATION=-